MSGEAPEHVAAEVPVAKRRLTIRGMMLGILILAPFLREDTRLIFTWMTYIFMPFVLNFLETTSWGIRLREDFPGTRFLFNINNCLFLVAVVTMTFLPGNGPLTNVDYPIGITVIAAPVVLSLIILWLWLTRPRTERKAS